ncbi:hypothetical protein EUGRSUZ_D00010 [Eucalyptus grandis]|uniref:Uncharacterized protein n=2 Tax=Eucalyptus grandis TaxID=71139 RepID=A0ACC3L1U9_EUCGR|nr:hypothetical protein EUGRSUZ_D00010 [Eucalyptus grandis]
MTVFLIFLIDMKIPRREKLKAEVQNLRYGTQCNTTISRLLIKSFSFFYLTYTDHLLADVDVVLLYFILF